MVRAANLIASFANSIERWRRARRDQSDLARMSARDLKDIGFHSESSGRMTSMASLESNCYRWRNPFDCWITVPGIVLGLGTLLLMTAAVVLPQMFLPLVEMRLIVPALTFAAILIGSVAAGLAGFAFSAVTGAMLFHFLPPETAVPLLLACSIATQLFSIAALWKTMEWRSCIPLLMGGIPGIPLGAYLLERLTPAIFTMGFGTLLICYSAYMLLRPRLSLQSGGGPLTAISIGFFGGITGGAVAFPGALPTIWCCLRALPKNIQRGTVQPFILIMQIATLAYFSKLGIFTTATGKTFVYCIPALVAGSWIGIRLFRRIDDMMFRRILLVFLLISGATLIL